MDAAENVAMAYQPEDDRNMPYYNVKRLNEQFQGNATAAKIYELSGLRELALVRSRIFGNAEVNTSVSAVHVPTNVYDGSKSCSFLSIRQLLPPSFFNSIVNNF